MGGHSSSWSRPGPIQLEDNPRCFRSALTETPPRLRPIRLRPIQRPFLGTGLSRTQGNQEPLCCEPVGTNPFLKVSNRSTPSDYPAELSLLLPLNDRYPNLSHTQSEDSHACSQYSHSYCHSAHIDPLDIVLVFAPGLQFTHLLARQWIGALATAASCLFAFSASVLDKAVCRRSSHQVRCQL